MRTATAIATMILLTATAHAGDNVITNYFTGYVYIPATYTNAGDTGLTVSNAYLCFPASLFSANLTATQAATATGDVRAVMYSINQEFYESREAATNKTASTIARGATYAGSGTNVLETVTHILKTVRQFGSATLP